MRELNFLRDQKLHDAWCDVQWNFMEDVEKEVERQISHYLNKVLRIEADRQLGAARYERALARVDYRAGYRRRSLITPKGTFELMVPKARSTPLRFSLFDRYRRLWKRVDRILCEIFLAGSSIRRTASILNSRVNFHLCLLMTNLQNEFIHLFDVSIKSGEVHLNAKWEMKPLKEFAHNT